MGRKQDRHPRKRRTLLDKAKRLRLVEAVASGRMSKEDVAALHDLSPKTVANWVRAYLASQPDKIPKAPLESESERVATLEAALDQSRLENEALKQVIVEAERELGVDIRKKYGRSGEPAEQ